MRTFVISSIVATILFGFLPYAHLCQAEEAPPSETFTVRSTLRDADPGPVKKWVQRLANRRIQRVTALARKESGDVKLSLTIEGSAGTPSKEFPVSTETLSPVIWNFEKELPKADRVNLEAVTGAVYVESVTIDYSESGGAALDRPDRISGNELKRLEALNKKLHETTSEAGTKLRRTLRPSPETDKALERVERLQRATDLFGDEFADHPEQPERLKESIAQVRVEFEALQSELKLQGIRAEERFRELAEFSALLKELEKITASKRVVKK